MNFRLTLILLTLLVTSVSQAEQTAMADIKAPADLDNIHVVKLYSDKHASDFIVFVKKSVPLHKHAFHSETIYILEGTGIMRLGDETFEVKPGDFIKVPESTPHTVKTTSEMPLKALSIQAPEFFGKDRIPVK